MYHGEVMEHTHQYPLELGTVMSVRTTHEPWFSCDEMFVVLRANRYSSPNDEYFYRVKFISGKESILDHDFIMRNCTKV